MHFLFNTIDFQKQSVESTLKVLGKSLETVLDEVHFTVNRYNSPIPLVPPRKPFLLQRKSFASLPGRKTSKTLPSSSHIDNSLSVYLFLEFEP